MRDVSRKIKTLRSAVAEAVLSASPLTIAEIKNRTLPKGDALEVARVAAVQAAKNTSQIIPYCHPVGLDYAGVEYDLQQDRIRIEVSVKAIDRTGVEMEALTAASVAALTIYDMAKYRDDAMTISEVRLLRKKGGKSDFLETFPEPLRAAVLVMSDSIASGAKSDESGKAIVARLQEESVSVCRYEIIPDDEELIASRLISYADEEQFDLVITTGGTGFSPRDNTPEAMRRILHREIPGIPEAVRSYGQERTPYSMLSRARAGLRDSTLIVNLPGSRKGVADALDALFPALLHSFKMIRGFGHPQQEALEGRTTS